MLNRLIPDWLENHKEYTLALLRVALGAILMAGELRVSKGLVSFFDQAGIFSPSITAPVISGFEFIGGLALILGFSTRYVAILFVIEFAVASYVVMDMTGTVFASARLPLLILFINAFLATSGGGRFSVDRVLVSRLRRFRDS